MIKRPFTFKPPNFYDSQIIQQYAVKETKRVTLRQLTVFGRSLTKEKVLKSANYVREELPIRLAHRIRDFQSLPYIVGANPHIAKVYSMYWRAFEIFRSIPPIKTLHENDEFCDITSNMLKTHLTVIPQLALGISETSELMDPVLVDRFMNEMLRSRIGRRVLAEQHLALTHAFKNPYMSDMVGIVDAKCQAKDLIKKCIRLSRDIFHTIYTIDPPNVTIEGHENATFTYIPDHLEYILFELLKNAMYHNIKHHADWLLESNDAEMKDGDMNFPNVIVTVGQGEGEVVFRISDQGGGIKREILENLWSFSHVSKLKMEQIPELAAKAGELVPPTMHLGLGLCMSKAYANYWGGTINVYSMQGYGTDIYLRIATGNLMEHL